MILECPACHAQFNVPDGAIPPAGRTVRCSACKHEWHATPETAAAPKPAPKAVPQPVVAPEPPEPEAPTVQVDHSFLEELTKATESPDESIAEAIENPQSVAEPAPAEEVIFPRPQPKAPPAPAIPVWVFKLAAPSLALIWLVVGLFAYFPQWSHGPLSGIYKLMGVVETDGVVLADVAMQREQEGQRTRFLISGNIVNQEAKERTIPVVRVQMLDGERNVLWAREYEVGKTLKPGEIYPFRITNAETSFAHNVAQLVVDVGHPLQLMFR